MYMYVFAFNAIQRWISLAFMALAVHEVEPNIFIIIPSMSYTEHFQLPVSLLAWNHLGCFSQKGVGLMLSLWPWARWRQVVWDATVPDNMVLSYRLASV